MKPAHKAVSGGRSLWGSLPRHRLARKLADLALTQVDDDLAGVFPGTRATSASRKVLLAMSVVDSMPVAEKAYPGPCHDRLIFPALE